MKKKFTAEELISRWEDVRAIENLMGRRSFYGLLGQNDKIWREYWCKETEDPCIGFNTGYYKGYDAIGEYFEALHRFTLRQTELVQAAFPDKLGHKTQEELYNVGNLICTNITTPLIELAEDGNTAKGLWYVMGTDFFVGASGPESWHSWGRLGVDFIRETDGWKIWHMIFAEDLHCPTGSSWANAIEKRPVDPRFAALADFDFPRPNVPVQVHEAFHTKRRLEPFPQLPERYKTFAETFSYGI